MTASIKKVFVIITISMSVLAVPLAVTADTAPDPNTGIGQQTGEQIAKNNNPIDLAGRQFTNLICRNDEKLHQCLPRALDFIYVTAGLVALILLIVWGYQYMASGGDGGKARDSRERLTSLGQGIFLLLASYIILQFLNPNFTTLIETPFDIGMSGEDANGNDTQPPVLTVIKPVNNDTIGGTFILQAQATDNRGVKDIVFNLDGTTDLATVATPSSSGIYSYDWNTTSVPVGTHQVWIKARDAANNESAMQKITVDVRR